MIHKNFKISYEDVEQNIYISEIFDNELFLWVQLFQGTDICLTYYIQLVYLIKNLLRHKNFFLLQQIYF
jgi:hypothetical protein